jgi:hypothetical protein
MDITFSYNFSHSFNFGLKNTTPDSIQTSYPPLQQPESAPVVLIRNRHRDISTNYVETNYENEIHTHVLAITILSSERAI